jgi:hypothetical protein
VVYVVVVRVVVEVWLVGVEVGEGGCRVLGYSVGRWRRHLCWRAKCWGEPEATGYEVVLVGVIVGVMG